MKLSKGFNERGVTMEYIEKINRAVDYIKTKFNFKIDIAIILGTGLGSLVNDITERTTIKYSEIPGFPVSTVSGHAGELVIGSIGYKKVMVLNGRFHYYEGYTMEEVTFAVRVIKALGINDIIITNAAGGMNPIFCAGDLMIISDHINLMGTNPLIGKNYDELGPRFPDMSNAYNRELIKITEEVALKLDVKVQKGVYSAVSGPNFETSAELKMFRLIGGDSIGMSTIPEVIVANHMGMRVLGISCITDMAIAEGLQPIDHQKVLDTANKSMTKFIKLVKGVVEQI